MIVGDANASVNPGLVNVETAAVIQDDFEYGIPPAIVFAGSAGTGHLENRVNFKEISLRAVSLHHSLIS